MKPHHFLMLLFFLPAHFLHGQEKTSDHQKVYENASQLGDYATAISSLHYLLLDVPEESPLWDSLAYLYKKAQQPSPCVTTCERILQHRPFHTSIRELAAEIYLQYGAPEAALDHFSVLYQQENSYFFRFRVASLQVYLGEYGKANAHISSMLTDSGIDSEKIFIDWGDGRGNVPLRAALLNLQGNLELALGRESNAKRSWRAALKLDKSFKLPRKSLNALQKNQWEQQEWENDR